MRKSYWIIGLLVGLVGGFFIGKSSVDCEYEAYKLQKAKGQQTEIIHQTDQNNVSNIEIETDVEIPARVYEVLAYIRENGRAPDGVQGGRTFYNREGLLPKGETYQEWDVHIKVQGQNRGAERIVTSSEKAYYTKDHYKSFILIKEER